MSNPTATALAKAMSTYNSEDAPRIPTTHRTKPPFREEELQEAGRKWNEDICRKAIDTCAPSPEEQIVRLRCILDATREDYAAACRTSEERVNRITQLEIDKAQLLKKIEENYDSRKALTRTATKGLALSASNEDYVKAFEEVCNRLRESESACVCILRLLHRILFCGNRIVGDTYRGSMPIRLVLEAIQNRINEPSSTKTDEIIAHFVWEDTTGQTRGVTAAPEQHTDTHGVSAEPPPLPHEVELKAKQESFARSMRQAYQDPDPFDVLNEKDYAEWVALGKPPLHDPGANP